MLRTFQPMNVNFGLFPELPKGGKIRGKDRKQAMSARALEDLSAWLGSKQPRRNSWRNPATFRTFPY